MAFLLDTNVVCELRRPRPHGGVVAWIQSVDDAELYLASATIGLPPFLWTVAQEACSLIILLFSARFS